MSQWDGDVIGSQGLESINTTMNTILSTNLTWNSGGLIIFLAIIADHQESNVARSNLTYLEKSDCKCEVDAKKILDNGIWDKYRPVKYLSVEVWLYYMGKRKAKGILPGWIRDHIRIMWGETFSLPKNVSQKNIFSINCNNIKKTNEVPTPECQTKVC